MSHGGRGQILNPLCTPSWGPGGSPRAPSFWPLLLEDQRQLLEGQNLQRSHLPTSCGLLWLRSRVVLRKTSRTAAGLLQNLEPGRSQDSKNLEDSENLEGTSMGMQEESVSSFSPSLAALWARVKRKSRGKKNRRGGRRKRKQLAEPALGPSTFLS